MERQALKAPDLSRHELLRFRENSSRNAVGGVGEALDLAIDFLAQIWPDFFIHLEEDLDDFGVELLPRPLRNLGTRGSQTIVPDDKDDRK